MKKVIDVNIGHSNFSIEEDALIELRSYLSKIENSILDVNDRKEIMEDIEMRIAEIFLKDIKTKNQVVNSQMVGDVIKCIGDVEPINNTENTENKSETKYKMKKLYRNPDDKRITGVCGGIAAYFDIDSTIVRAIFVIAGLFYGTAFLVYLVLWLVMPEADTTVKKLRMRGEAINSENLKKNS